MLFPNLRFIFVVVYYLGENSATEEQVGPAIPLGKAIL